MSKKSKPGKKSKFFKLLNKLFWLTNITFASYEELNNWVVWAQMLEKI